MKILLIGGNGTIGKKVAAHLNEKHEVVIAGRKNADVQVDIKDKDSILRMFEQVPLIDAVVCTAGEAKWDNFNDLTEEDFYIGIRSKLMGQINLVRIGKDFINSGGSFTLTTGILGEDPVARTTSAARPRRAGMHRRKLLQEVLFLDNPVNDTHQVLLQGKQRHPRRG
mgnify:CR=1 FL=1